MYYKVNVNTGTAYLCSVVVKAFSESEAVDATADLLKESGFVLTCEKIEKLKSPEETVEEYAEANDLICCGNEGVYMSVDSIETLENRDYVLPVTWMMSGFVTVHGVSVEDAVKNFKEKMDDIPLPHGDYVDSSFELSTEDTDEIMAYNQ